MDSNADVPVIRRLTIERFRGIETLVWYPKATVNVVLGGGDVGKTTILDAIALLFAPTNAPTIGESDYHLRKVENGFVIEAVVSLPESTGINRQAKQTWPWQWNGTEPVVPDPEAGVADDPVYVVRVTGTPEFETLFEIVHPDDTVDYFTVGLRRSIGVVRLSGDDRNDRDLRLIQGSALDRLLSDKTLRARVGKRLADSDVETALHEQQTDNLEKLNDAFANKALPSGLGLGITGGYGLSANALIGLTAAEESGEKLPLASWGAGTRRLAALEIAAFQQSGNPLTLVDELERGLEPYRQRALMNDLQARRSQAFVTTHSPSVLKAASTAVLWYVDANSNIGIIGRESTKHANRDPEAFLSRLTIIAEGVTEVGFVHELLARQLSVNLQDHGIVITDGCGNDATLALAEEVSKAGLSFALFADDEGTHPVRWAAVKAALGDRCFRWKSACIEQVVIEHVDDNQLEHLILDPADDLTGARLRTLADRTNTSVRTFEGLRSSVPDLRRAIIEAATGFTPENIDSATRKDWKKHGRLWFKTVEGGRELAAKLFDLNLWPKLAPQLSPFVNAIKPFTVPLGSRPKSHE